VEVTRRADVAARLPLIFGLNRIEAAAAIGVSANTFDALVDAGQMPRPRLIKGRKVWDVDEVRAAFKCLPVEGGEDAGDQSWAGVG